MTSDERAEVKRLCKNHGVDFSSLGSPIGKANILGTDTDAAFAIHLDQVVKPTAEAAADFGIKKF